MALPGQDRFLTFLRCLGLHNVDPSTIEINLVRAQVTADIRQHRGPALRMDWVEQELQLFLCWRNLLRHGVLAPVALASCSDEDREVVPSEEHPTTMFDPGTWAMAYPDLFPYADGVPFLTRQTKSLCWRCFSTFSAGTN